MRGRMGALENQAERILTAHHVSLLIDTTEWYSFQALSMGTIAIVDKSQMDCVFLVASCRVWFSCRWLHSQTEQCVPDGSGAALVGQRNTHK